MASLPIPPSSPISEEAYLRFERASDVKHELRDGVLYAMSGASREHNLISWNLGAALHVGLDRKPCEAYFGDMRVKVADSGLYVYPDVVVSCDGPKFLDGQFDTLENPILVIEIFSPSTRRLDQLIKAPYYRRAPSIQEFLFILQDEPTIQRYSRRGNDWIASDHQGLEAVLPLDSLGFSIPLTQIYRRVTFPPAQAESAVT